MAHDLDHTARYIFQKAMDEDRCGELLECLFDGGSATVDPNGRLVIVTNEVLAQMKGKEKPPSHAYCTDDDCPCFAAGEEAVWEQIGDFMEDAEDRISQIRAGYIERFENRISRGQDNDE